ncbi:hypothetical protein Tco_1390120, partial [Tanacetum coccineum]
MSRTCSVSNARTQRHNACDVQNLRGRIEDDRLQNVVATTGTLRQPSQDNMEEAGPSVTENPTNGSVHLDLHLENDDDDMMIDALLVRDLDQPPE